MKSNPIVILGVVVRDRIKEAGHVQEILTEFGCSIKTRLGIHEVSEDHCSQSGIIILELFGDLAEQRKLEKKLKETAGVEIQRMAFTGVE